MRLKGIVVYGCKRIAFGQFKAIEITINSFYQLFLGTNGSGKSTLLQIAGCYPLPSNNFIKGGWYQLLIEHNHSDYILEVDYAHGTKCSFKKDGEELNEGYTQTVQRRLILDHFKYSQDLHDLLTGKQGFAGLSTAKRREWFNRLNPVDMSYALALFNRVKVAARDNAGALSYVREELAKAKLELASLNDRDTLANDVQRVRRELNELYAKRGEGVKDPGDVKRRLDSALNKIESLSIAIIKTKDTIANLGVKDVGGLGRRIEACDIQLTQLRAMLGPLSERHDYFKNILSKAVGLDSAEILKVRQSTLTKREAVIRSQLTSTYDQFAINHDTITTVIKTAEEVLLLLMAMEARDAFPRQPEVTAANDRVYAVTLELQRAKSLLERLEHRLLILDDVNHVDCPKCSNRFQPGVDAEERNVITLRLEKGRAIIEQLTAELTVANQARDAVVNYLESHRRLLQVSGRCSALANIVGGFDGDPKYVANPKMFAGVIKDFIRDATLSVELHTVRDELKQINSALEIIEMAGDLETAQKQYEAVTVEIQNTSNKIMQLEQQVKTLKDGRAAIINYSEMVDSHAVAIKVIDELMALYSESVVKTIVNETIEQRQSTLALLERRLHDTQRLDDAVIRLEGSLGELESKEKAYAELIKRLSPTDGLIANQQKGFIKAVVDQVNKIIKNIWTYELRVMPCGMDSGDLDYNFPLVVDGVAGPEMSDGSMSQIDVVSFAFKQVLMCYSGLDFHPLFCDELGNMFDEAHRIKLLNYIKLLVESKRYSQLFMISHYAAQFGALPNAEICVINSNNLTLPFEYNQHVKLTNEVPTCQKQIA